MENRKAPNPPPDPSYDDTVKPYDDTVKPYDDTAKPYDDTAKSAEVSRFSIPMLVRVRDTISGFSGRVTGRTEYSTGCRQYLLIPPVGDDGTYREGQWFDEERLERLIVKIEGPGLSPQGEAQLHKAVESRPPALLVPREDAGLILDEDPVGSGGPQSRTPPSTTSRRR